MAERHLDNHPRDLRGAPGNALWYYEQIDGLLIVTGMMADGTQTQGRIPVHFIRAYLARLDRAAPKPKAKRGKRRVA